MAKYNTKQELVEYLLDLGSVMPQNALDLALRGEADVDFIKYLFSKGVKYDLPYNLNAYEEDYLSSTLFAQVKTYLQQQKVNKQGGRKTYRRKRTTRSRR
jgi:hypothetical protein